MVRNKSPVDYLSRVDETPSQEILTLLFTDTWPALAARELHVCWGTVGGCVAGTHPKGKNHAGGF